MALVISPTGLGARGLDSQGSGAYGASRDMGARKHNGTDFICKPGQEVFSPISGFIVRTARPYPIGIYSGLVIAGRSICITMFYLDPEKDLVGHFIAQGDVIGTAQDISLKYRGITPHIHLQIDSIDPALLMGKGGL